MKQILKKLLNKLGNTTDRRAQFVGHKYEMVLIWKTKVFKGVLFQVKLQMGNMANEAAHEKNEPRLAGA